MKQIKTAENAGTCFGVNNAIKIAFEAADREEGREKNIYILGELVHNPVVVSKLEAKGVTSISDCKKLKEGDILIIRAHGELKEVYDYCKKNNIMIIDCTCAFVKKAQDTAKMLEDKGYNVVIIGDPDHPEVRSIRAKLKDCTVIRDPDDVDMFDVKKGKIGILSQTTQTFENFSETIARIVKYPRIIKIHNTICTATQKRQNAAKKLAKEVDVMVVIGGRNSSNTKKLYELCSPITKTYWIVTASELKKEWFENAKIIGITAGASTPKESIEEVSKILKDF